MIERVIPGLRKAEVSRCNYGVWGFATDGIRIPECSYCGKASLWPSQYCPKCGARMVNEEDALRYVQEEKDENEEENNNG